ncbi:MAG: response regulator [Rhodobacteraceae bacterium]|nr:response regulator [Paracoccaceae bacterium]
MTDRSYWHDEILRQGQRLESDLVSRQVGILLAYILAAILIPFWVVFLAYLGNVLSEVMMSRLLRKFAIEPSRGLYAGILGVSAFGFALFTIPAILLWQMEEPLIKVTGFLYLVGALLNVSVMRSTHLAIGIATGLPPALVLLWLPLQHVFDFGQRFSAVIATAGIATLLGYFLSSLIQNNRAQRQLVDAAHRDRDASLEKSNLLRTLGHEVRTPLNSILGHSQMLRGEHDAAAAGRHTSAIEWAARDLQMLVDDVLDLASVTEHEMMFRPVTASIRRELLRVKSPQALGPFSDLAKVEIDVADEVPEIGRFDPILLRRCLGGLALISLGNRKRGDAAELSIRCALAPGRQDRLRLTLIASSATGKAPSRRVAENDAQVRPAIPDPRESLSKSLINGIAAIMGAEASILRAPDNSTVTRIELPFVTVPDPPPTGAEQVYGRLNVLVVDDIASNRMVMMQLLRSMRIDAVEVPGGREAIQFLAAHEFDLVLLDMNMPEMDGEATLSAIRSGPETVALTPVIAVTADASTHQREHYIALGMDGYLSKPVDRNLLWAEILAAVPPPPPL